MLGPCWFSLVGKGSGPSENESRRQSRRHRESNKFPAFCKAHPAFAAETTVVSDPGWRGDEPPTPDAKLYFHYTKGLVKKQAFSLSGEEPKFVSPGSAKRCARKAAALDGNDPTQRPSHDFPRDGAGARPRKPPSRRAAVGGLRGGGLRWPMRAWPPQSTGPRDALHRRRFRRTRKPACGGTQNAASPPHKKPKRA